MMALAGLVAALWYFRRSDTSPPKQNPAAQVPAKESRADKAQAAVGADPSRAAATPAPVPPADAAPVAQGIPIAPRRLQDFSKQSETASEPTAVRREGLAALRAKLPQVRVQFDPVTGAPSSIGSVGQFLTPAGAAGAGGDPVVPVRKFIGDNAALFGHDASALVASRVTRDDVTAHNGMRTVVWQQQLDGVPLYNAILKANLTKDGALVAVGSQFMSDPAAATHLDAAQRAALIAAPPVDVSGAVSTAATNIGETVPAAQVVSAAAPDGTEKRQTLQAPALSDVVAKLSWLPMDAATSRLTWDVTLMSVQRKAMYQVLVDVQTGEVLLRRSLTADISNASYRVYADGTTLQPLDSPSPMSPGLSTPGSTQPATSTRNLVTTQALDAAASPNGWIDDGGTATYGNNVDAHLDTGSTNPTYGTGTHAVSATRNFDFTLDLAQDPSTYQSAALTSLFYACNYYHDKLYQLGFTESAGNFQQNNFGKGGVGNDAVLADAQDGSGTNNANFSTPADGSPGRMQMYIFTGPTPHRDGDLDMEVVFHEHTHGLSNRLVGGGVGISKLQTQGMGEGWSDFYALCLLSQPTDDVNGTYPAGAYASYQLSGLTQNYYYGIRRYPYTTDMSKNPLTLKDIDPTAASAHSGVPLSPIMSPPNVNSSEVHNQGEVWCVTLWDVRANLVNKLGAVSGNQMVLQLVTDGMKLAPANPTFLQARDAIVQADLVDNGGANKNELWAAFAKRGMGASASVPVNTTTTGVVEAYDIPDNLNVTPATIFASSGQVGGPFTPVTQTYTLTNNGTSSLTWSAATNQGWLTVSSNGGTLAAGANVSVTVTVGSAANTLPAGSYSATTTFTDITTNAVITRQTSLSVSAPRVKYFPLDTDPGWTRQGEWAFGKPTGVGGGVIGNPDPSNGATGTNVFGINLNGLYSTAIGGPYYLTTTAIDLSNYSGTQLRFKRWLNTDYPPYATSTVQVSNNGSTWTTLYTNPGTSFVTDSSWTTAQYDISAVADNRSTVYIRWSHQIGSSGAYSATGWNIDDVEILGSPTAGLALSLGTNNVTEGSAPVTATLNITPVPASDTIVNLASSDTNSATVPASVTILAGQSSITFPVTIIDNAVLDGTRNVTLTASTAGYSNGSTTLVVNDNEAATFSVSAPATTSEGVGTVQGTLSLSGGVPTNPVAVSLASSDTSALTVPATVTIPAGQTSVNFNIAIVDDNKINGTHSATITAHVAGWTDGTATVNIQDNESKNLTLSLPATVFEGGTGSGTVSISGTLTSALSVSLVSGTTSRLTVPASVTIPAGSTSATFSLTAPDNSMTDGTAAVSVTASASGFTNGTGTSNVLDNEVNHFSIATIASPQALNSPFSVTITALDANNVAMPAYTGAVNFTAANGMTVSPATSGSFVNGQWTGTVSLSGAPGNTVLTATNGAGATGQSNAFNVALPAASTLTLASNDIVYDPGTQKIYVSVASSDTTGRTNTVTPLDPNTQQFGTPIAIGAEASKLAVSGDNQFLYVGLRSANSISRVTLASQSVGLQIGLGTSPSGTLIPEDIQVLPGNPHSIAVSRMIGSNNYGVAVFDDATQRSTAVSSYYVCSSIAFGSSPDTLYGVDGDSSGFEFSRFTISSSGIAQQDSLSYVFHSYGVKIEMGTTLLFGSDGTVIDPVNRTLVAQLPVSGPVQPDQANGRVYYLGQGSDSSHYVLHVFSTTTFAEIGSLTVSGVSGTPGSLISWPGGLAFRTSGGQIYLINTALVAPPANTADLSITQIASPSPATVGQNLTFTFYVTNNGPVSAANVNVSDVVPGGTTYVGATSSQGSVSAANGTVTANLGTLASGASATVSVTVVPMSTATLTNQGTVSSATSDPLTGNNTSTQTVTVNSAGTGNTKVAVLPLTANDLAYDSVGNRLYADVPASGGALANSLLRIVPSTGGVESVQFIGSDPGRLVSSSDGQFLYAALLGANNVSRFNLSTQTLGTQISLGTDKYEGFLTAEDLAILPGSPNSVAVSRYGSGSYNYGIAVFDDNIQRPAWISGPYFATSIAFGSSPGLLYGYNGDSSGFDFRRCTVNANGVAQLDSTQNLISGYSTTIRQDSDLIYASSGAVVNPKTKSLLTTIPASGLVCPESSRNRVYFLTQSGSTATLKAFDATTYAQVASSTVSGLSGTAGSLVRCGGNRLAFRTTGNQVFIVNDATLVPSVLGLNLPSTTVEGAGTLSGAGKATVSEPQATDILVNLSSSDTTKITVPATVTIPAGQTFATFDVTVIDNSVLDGPHVSMVTASATGFSTARGNIQVNDNEMASFSVALPTSGTQGTVVQGTVTISAPATNDIVVSLSSNSPWVSVPSTVTILAGQTSAVFNITLLEAGQIIGPQNASITAHVDNWTDGASAFTVVDSQTPANWPTFGNGAGHTAYQATTLGANSYIAGWSASDVGTSALNQAAINGGSVYVTAAAGNGYVKALDALSGAQLWRYQYAVSAFSVNPPTFSGGNVYVQRSNNSGDTNLWSFNGATGAINWSVPFGSQWEHYFAPTVLNGGLWMDGGSYGGLYGFDAANGSQRFFNSSLEQYDQWAPAYYNGVVYTWIAGNFRAHDPQTGAVLWTLNLGWNWSGWSMNTAPVVNQGKAFVVGSPNFYAIDLTTHLSPWSATGTFKGTPAVANNVVYVMSADKVYAYNEQTGALIGTYVTGNTAISGQPIVTDDSLIVTSASATYIFNLSNFTLRQTLSSGGTASLANGILYLAGSDGILRSFYPAGSPLADTSITQSLTPNPAPNGTTVTITLNVGNSGPVTASSAVVRDALPAGLNFVSATSSQGTCTQSGGIVTCALGDLANGASATVTITATSNGAGNQTNSATITSATYDPNGSNNTSAVMLNLMPPTVVTQAATAVSSSSATLNGTVNANGLTATTSFDYGLTTAYGSTTSGTPSSVSGTSATAVNATIYGLTASTTYHYRIRGVNANGTGTGSDGTFTTPNNNANLSNLVPSAGTLSPVFSSSTTSYTASVAYSNSSITLIPTVADSTATVKVGGVTVASGSASAPISLSVGTNWIYTTVTAQDGSTTKTYSLAVTRAGPSTNADLSNLALSAASLTPVFSSSTTSYTASVPYTTTSTTVTPTVADATATVKVNGVTVASGTPSAAIGLAVGANTITTTAIAQDGLTTKTYTVVVTRAASGPPFVNTGSMSGARSGQVTALLGNGKVLVAGGTNGGALATAELYDPTTGTWTNTGSLNMSRYQATATLLPNGKVLVTGGFGVSGALATAELYDPSTGTWSVTGSLHSTRRLHNAVLLPTGKVLVAGGFSSSALLTAEVYDPASGVWTVTNSMSTARYFAGATLLSSGKVLFAGGIGSAGVAIVTAEIYDPSTGTWTGTQFGLHTARYYHTLTALPNGKALIAGGYDGTNLLASAEVYDPSSNSWPVTGSMTNARDFHTASLLPNGQVLVTGGVGATAEIYDPSTGTWAMAPSLNAAHSQHTATILPNGKMLIAGGAGTVAETYDISSGTWANTGSTSAVHQYHAALMLPNGQVLVAGGFSTSSAVSELYNPVSGTWTNTGSLNVGRAQYAAVLLNNGKVLVAGGNSGNAMSSCELYNPATGTWSVTGSLSVIRTAETATVLPNGKVLVAGGMPTGSTATYASCELYDPATGTWTPTGSMNVPHNTHLAVLLPNGKVLVASGFNTGNLTTDAELYDPGTGAWTTTGSMNALRNSATATLLPNGKVLVAGGLTPGSALASAELYNPATGTWTPTGSMSVGRYLHTATLLPNGKVLVSSGQTGSSTTPVSELYDPATGTWSVTANVSTARAAGAATLLLNGKVLLTGGSGVSASELFDPGLGYSAAWQPQVTSAPATLTVGGTLQLNGTGFTGISGASSGSIQDSSSNYPVVQLLALANGQTTYLLSNSATNWSATSFTSAAVNGFPTGYALATVFTNGIPSNSVVVNVVPSSNANLSNLALSSGTLAPVFSSGTTSYTASVPSATSSMTVTPTLADSTATVKVNGVAVASGSASSPIALTVGANTVTTVVTAQDGVTTKTYSIVVTRAASSNANLSNLVLSAGTLSPVFSSATTSYSASVTNETTAVTLTPTIADATASVTVNGVPVTSGTASAAINLNVGANTLTTAVTAQDGTTVVTYSVVVTRLAGLQSWRLKYFGTTANSGDTADTGDFDHNGIPNLMKYAFGLDPTSPASRSLPQPTFDGNALTITFTEPVGILGVTYGAEWSANVNSGTWSSVPDTGAGTTHIFSVPMSGKAAGFLRLKITGQ